MNKETEDLLNRINASTSGVYKKIMDDQEFLNKCVNGIKASIKKSRDLAKELENKSDEEIKKAHKNMIEQSDKEQAEMFKPIAQNLAPIKHSFLKEIAALDITEYIEFDLAHAMYSTKEMNSFNQFLMNFAKPQIQKLMREMDEEEMKLTFIENEEQESSCPIFPLDTRTNEELIN